MAYLARLQQSAGPFQRAFWDAAALRYEIFLHMLFAEGLFAVNDEGHGLVSVIVHPNLAFAGKVVRIIGSLLYMRVAAAIVVHQ
ncbi:hypothetical protein QMA79_19335 [Pseudomonas aeruginosa]|uniref:hypothetical protein n=1 Tax=Pseudomonas aeruginosa TaxID=287 RepID=UPI0024ACD3C3|nr:hypothetical protein [Pseudomonas aeruginosa]MDI6671970.1 hypothetical protein [Pseudomonas aeruginosa]